MQAGPGTLVLNGSNNYTGVTAVNAGLLEIATSGSLYGGNSASWTATNISVAGGAHAGGHDRRAERFQRQRRCAGRCALLARLRSASRLLLRLRHHQLGDLGLGARGDCLVVSLPRRGLSHARRSLCNNAFGISKLGTGTLVLLASNGNTYTGGTSVANGELVMQGTGGAGAVSVTNSIPQGTTVLSVQNSEALGDRHLDEAVEPDQLERHGRQPLGFHSRDWGQAGHQHCHWQYLGLCLRGGSGRFDARQRPDQPQPECLGRQQQRRGLCRIQRRFAFHAADRGSAGGGRWHDRDHGDLADAAGGDLLRRRQPPDAGLSHRQQHAGSC